jgi:hypothetical protein
MTDFLSLLDSADLPEHVKAQLRAAQPAPVPHAATLVNRLSLVRTFTERLFDVAAAGLEPQPTFSSFIATPDVASVVGYPGRFEVSDKTRLWERIAHWVQDRTGIDDLARRYLDVLDPNDPVERLDRLQVGFMVDQPKARAALREAFESADRANDVPGCSALVQIAAPVIRLFGDQDSTRLLDELRSRSQSRNLFFAEFYQTARYFARSIDDELRGFVHRSDDPWIFHFYATGGMGKTTVLRRLISHEWIIGQRHIPCAWLDFDYLDVATVVQHPALLGLAMAVQWNEQLEQRVFGGYLTPSFQPLASLLFRTRTDAAARKVGSESLNERARAQYRAGLSNPMRCGMLAGAVPPRTLEERTQRLSQTPILRSYWNDKLPDALASMPADRPIVLVLDTLEDASLQHGQQLLDTLRLIATLRNEARKLAKARGQAPINLRLILSGRHRLGDEHVPEFKTEFAGQYYDRALPGLAASEASVFLDQEIDQQKHVEHRGALIDAMVSKSEGIPFNLSLFAEWANEDTSIDETVVAQSVDVSTVMLIERIVKRIPYQPLRWIVRYGVVPRTLSLDYLREVMREPLLEALSGQALATGLDTPESGAEQDVWTREAGFVFDASMLWTEKVRPYAGERNWMMPGEHSEEVTFRSDILQPMRRLLRSQRIFERLHARSRDWFAAQAKDPARWSNAIVDQLYHEVQLGTIPGSPRANLLPRLRTVIDAPQLQDDAALRATVCRQLRTPDVTDLTNGEKAYVQYRLAEAIAAQHGFAFTDPEAAQALIGAMELNAGAVPSSLPPFAFEWNAAITGVPVSELIGRYPRLPEDDRLRAALLISEVAERGSGAADGILESALNTAQSLSAPSIAVGVIAARLAHSRAEALPEAAIEPFRIAADDYGRRGNSAGRSDMLRRESEMLLVLGRLEQAEKTLQPLESLVRTPAVRLQLARIELAKGNPGRALDVLAHVESSGTEHTESMLLAAEALSQRMLLGPADRIWEGAVQVAGERADSRALAAAAIGRARFYYRRLRTTPISTPGVVQSLLQRTYYTQASVEASGRAATNQGPPAEVEIWQMLYGPPDDDRWRRRALGDLGAESPAARIRLILALAQVVSPFPPSAWDELIEMARRIQRSARVAALADPVLAGNGSELPDPLRRRIAETFRYEPEGEIEGAWYGVRYGELLAWLGFVEPAVELLAQLPVLKPAASTQGWVAAVYRERRRVEQRIRDRNRARGESPGYPAPDPDPPALWATFWEHTPFRAAAALVENARRASDAGAFDIVRDCLDRAEPELQRFALETEFHITARDLRTSLLRARFDHAPPVDVQRQPNLKPEGHDDRLGGPIFSVAEIRQQAGRIAISHDLTHRESVISAESRTVELLVRSRGIPRRLAGLPLEDIVADLEDLFSQGLGAPGGQRLALKTPLSVLSSAPWELAIAGPVRPFRLPTTWYEAHVASESDRILSVLQPESLMATKPLLVQPWSPVDRESPAVNSYAALRSYFPGQVDQDGIGGLGGGVEVMYIASSFVEVPSLNEPALAGLEWTASTLAYRISGGQHGIKPLVVLDVPVPLNASDLVHQLLLRNYFAQALIDSGSVACVIATGLHEGQTMAEMHRLFLTQPAASLGTRAEVLDRLAEFVRSDRLASHDALFTANPHLPLLAGIRPLPHA